uniref:Uncharacterized protein n=1 Tax=Plectus sambesii TaxID=2011161 RepID=A0A914V4L9_9BILA
MERSEFAYPPLHDSSDEEAEDGENYLLDVEEMKSPVRTPVINDTSNSFGSDHLDGNLDSLLQAPDFNLYDNLIDECPQESVEVRCERQETELAECQRMIESLRAQLVAEQCKNKKLSKSLHATLATFRTERNQKEETINELKQRSQRLLAVSCPYCDKGFDANSASIRRPSPSNTRILRGQCVVELKFGNYDTLRVWVLAADLETNTDGLPTLPDSLADSLLPAKQPQPLSLASAGSQLVRPVKEQPLSPDACGTVGENDCKRSTEMPTKVKSGIPSPPILMDAINKRIPKKCSIPPLRSKNDGKADGGDLRPDLDRGAAECRGALRRLIRAKGKDLAEECHHRMVRAADRDRGRFLLPVGVLLVDALLPLRIPSKPIMKDSDESSAILSKVQYPLRVAPLPGPEVLASDSSRLRRSLYQA